MRLNHIAAALAVVACLSFVSSAVAEPPTGACCPLVGLACTEGTSATCQGAGGFYQNNGSVCPSSGNCGACCFETDIASGCGATVESKCTVGDLQVGEVAVTFLGDGVGCVGSSGGSAGSCPSVPAVSEWGMASLGLLLLAGLTVKFGAFRKAA